MLMPYLYPDDNFHLNIAISIILIKILGHSSRGIPKLNNERLHIYTYLVRNPVKLNQVLNAFGKDSMLISSQESYSISSISTNVDLLFDRAVLKATLTSLVSEKLVEVVYKKNDGFLYTLSKKGTEKYSILNGDYFSEIRSLCDKLKSTLSYDISSLNQALNQIMRKEFTEDGK